MSSVDEHSPPVRPTQAVSLCVPGAPRIHRRASPCHPAAQARGSQAVRSGHVSHVTPASSPARRPSQRPLLSPRRVESTAMSTGMAGALRSNSIQPPVAKESFTAFWRRFLALEPLVSEQVLSILPRLRSSPSLADLMAWGVPKVVDRGSCGSPSHRRPGSRADRCVPRSATSAACSPRGEGCGDISS